MGDGARWPDGARAAVSLTYDGALLDHLEIAAPLLDELGLRAGFYLTPTGLLRQPQAWRKVAERHEIGSATLAEAANREGDLPNWTPQMVEDDFASVAPLLREALGVEDGAGFSFPGRSSRCLVVDYRPLAKRCFSHAKWREFAFNRLPIVERHALQSIDTHDMEGVEMIGIAQAAINQGEWVIFTFSGLGTGEVVVDSLAHDRLLRWLARQE